MMTTLTKVLALVLMIALTFEAPAPEPAAPTMTGQERTQMLQQLEQTEDLEECLRLGTALELGEIDVERFRASPEELDALYEQMLATTALPWFTEMAWSLQMDGDGKVVSFQPQYLDPADYDRTRYEKAVEEALAQAVHPGMTELQIALSLHDYLAVRCAYDETLVRGTEYDALVRGSAVCQGYAEAYMDLLGRVGIECIIVTSEEMNHAWNQVKLGGQWYNVDLTWNDPTPNREGQACHGFFLISDGTMASEDYGYYGWVSPHECTDPGYETGQFWSDSISPVLYPDAGSCYLVRVVESGYHILRRDEVTGEETRLARMDFKYPDAFARGSRRIHFYTAGLSTDGEALYYTDVNGVRRLDLTSGEVSTVYEHDVSATREVLVGSFLEGDTLYLTAMDTSQEVRSMEVPYPAG